jgi:hypothetical protein
LGMEKFGVYMGQGETLKIKHLNIVIN